MLLEGRDVLTGGNDADTFAFGTLADSMVGASLVAVNLMEIAVMAQREGKPQPIRWFVAFCERLLDEQDGTREPPTSAGRWAHPGQGLDSPDLNEMIAGRVSQNEVP